MENKVKMCFNHSSATYDSACTIQQFSNRALLNSLLAYIDVSKPIHRIIDLGCGTGNSTQLLRKTFKYQKLYGVDIADQLLQLAENKLKTPSVQFIRASFNQPLEFKSLDLAYANMSIHWASDIGNTLSIIHNSLKNGCFFSFSIPLAGTLNEIKNAHKNIFFPLDAMKSIIDRSGFSLITMQQKTFIDKYSCPNKALKSIKNVGANMLSQQRKKGLAGKNLQTSIFKKTNVFDLTYQIGFFILKK